MMSKLTLITLAVLLSWTTAAFAASPDGRQGDFSGNPVANLFLLIFGLDVNFDSLITKEELETNNVLPLNSRASSSLIRFADSDGTGNLTYDEVSDGFDLLRAIFPISGKARLLTFKIYDTNNNGFITETELMNVSATFGPLRTGNISSVFKTFDSNNNGLIDYVEFAKILPLAQDLDVVILSLIRRFDTNENGIISKEELKNNAFLPLSMCDVNYFVAFVDTSGDGSIDANELTIGLSKLRQSPSVSAEARLLIFNIYDTNEDRVVSEAELEVAVPIIGSPSQGNISSILSDFDDNNDGGIEYIEFANNLPLAREQ